MLIEGANETKTQILVVARVCSVGVEFGGNTNCKDDLMKHSNTRYRYAARNIKGALMSRETKI